jgi:hypothetical protein
VQPMTIFVDSLGFGSAAAFPTSPSIYFTIVSLTLAHLIRSIRTLSTSKMSTVLVSCAS